MRAIAKGIRAGGAIARSAMTGAMLTRLQEKVAMIDDDNDDWWMGEEAV